MTLRTLLALSIFATSTAWAAPPPSRLLADAQRRVERGDFEGALDRLDALEGDLTAEEEAQRDRVSADAHRLSGTRDGAKDPAGDLNAAFEAHQRCVASEIAVHRKYCQRQQEVLVRSLAERAGKLASALELGGAVSATEIGERCTQLRTLEPAGANAPRCLARLAWSRTDRERAETAFAWALPLEASERQDATLAQAAATLLHGLGDVEGTRALLAQVQSPGPRVEALGASLTVFEEKLAPKRATVDSEGTVAAWKSWLLALSGADLDVLAIRECDRALKALPDDPALLQITASVRTQAAAGVPKTGDTQGRYRRIQSLLRGAHEDLVHCAEQPEAPPRCAAEAERVKAQLDQLAERTR